MNTPEQGLPMPVPAEGLPARVRVHEVGARDGLQNEKATVPTAVKAEFVRRLAGTGLTAPSRRRASSTPSGSPSWRTRRSCSRRWPTCPSSCRCWCRTNAAWTGPSRSARAA
ncbi:hypothetical protein STENM36S_05683 [Streptomyces tendae]